MFNPLFRKNALYSTCQIFQRSWIFNPLFRYNETGVDYTCLVASSQSALWKNMSTISKGKKAGIAGFSTRSLDKWKHGQRIEWQKKSWIFNSLFRKNGNAIFVSARRKEPGFSILSSGKKKMLSSWHVQKHGAGSSICSSEIKKLQRIVVVVVVVVSITMRKIVIFAIHSSGKSQMLYLCQL